MPAKRGRVVVAGATGLVGSFLVERLLRDPRSSEVVALSRRPLAIKDPKLRVEIVDFAKLEDAVAGLAPEAVFCALGTTIKTAGSREAFELVDLEYPTRLARGAARGGSEEFLLLTALGADAKSKIFYSRTKGRAEEAVRNAFAGKLRIFRPSLLLGPRSDRRPGEALAQKLAPLVNPLLVGPLKPYRAVRGEDVARDMVSAWRASL
jgi:uncharacterized protein YbjT (DUF2867 family)